MKLQPICDRYAILLKLSAWKITARYAAPGEIRKGCVGQLEWEMKDGRGEASILIDPAPTHDHEITLAHELCHIPLIGHTPRSQRAGRTQEQAIDQYAGAIVRLRRSIIGEVAW